MGTYFNLRVTVRDSFLSDVRSETFQASKSKSSLYVVAIVSINWSENCGNRGSIPVMNKVVVLRGPTSRTCDNIQLCT